MATALTETSVFTATVVAPNDGDPGSEGAWTPGLQSAANRTRYLYNEALAVSSIGVYEPTGVWAGSGKLSFTEAYDRWGGFSHSAGDITVPAAGYYLIQGVIQPGAAATPNPVASFTIRKATTDVLYYTVRADVADGVEVRCPAVICGIIYIANPVTDVINFLNSSGTAIDYTNAAGGGSSMIVIRRIA